MNGNSGQQNDESVLRQAVARVLSEFSKPADVLGEQSPY